MLDDYETDNEYGKQSTHNETLSVATQGLLERLQPVKTANNDDIAEARIKVIFCSRTHSQLTQFINELRKVNVPSGLSQANNEEVIKHIPLGSRKNLCINPKVARLSSTTAINERCLELQKPGTSQEHKCEFLPNKSSHEDKQRLEDFRDNAMAQIQDIEDIATLGRRMKLCPYYASRPAIANTEVVTVPYPLLLQKSAREALGLEVVDNVVIIDEAHNITSAISDTLSVAMPLSHLVLAKQQLVGYCQKFKNRLKGKNRVYIAQIILVLKSCITRLEEFGVSKDSEMNLSANALVAGSNTDLIQPHKLVRYIQESKLVYKIEGYAELLDQENEKNRSNVKYRTAQKPQPKGVLAVFQNLLVAVMNPASEGRFFITKNDGDPMLKYTLLDPQAHFEDIVKQARSVILAGGTMSPMSDWEDQLFSYVAPNKIETFSFGHIISKDNVLVQAISRGRNNLDFDFTFANRLSAPMILDLANLLWRLYTTIPDGVVVFFPSYEYLAIVTGTWKRSDSILRTGAMKQIFQESKEVNVDDLLRDYASAIDTGKGALMLAVVGGKLSEGINFSDKLGRAVICVGLPYPNIKSAEWRAKVQYIEQIRYKKLKKEGVSEDECNKQAVIAGNEYADNTTMRAVNQSIGRAIRHKNDYAAIYLIDKRYATPRIQSKLPTWLKESVREGKSSWQELEKECADFFAGRS